MHIFISGSVNRPLSSELQDETSLDQETDESTWRHATASLDLEELAVGHLFFEKIGTIVEPEIMFRGLHLSVFRETNAFNGTWNNDWMDHGTGETDKSIINLCIAILIQLITYCGMNQAFPFYQI